MIIQAQNREQTMLFTSLEDLISKDNPVRLIDAIVKALIISDPDAYKYKGECNVGRPAYSVETMLKLYIYGYINRITSSRRLETEANRNIELIWLLGYLTPDFKTIADFRKDNKENINNCCKGLKKILMKNGLVSGAVAALDGTKLKANARRDMPTKKDIISRIKMLESEISSYLSQMDSQDESESSSEAEILILKRKHESELAKKQREIERLQTALDRLENSQGKNRVSLTDMDCNMQKSRDGMIPGYNIQIASDTERGFIVGEDVTAEANDINQLKPLVEEIERELETKLETVVADKGYSNHDEIQEIESGGTDCYVPPNKEQVRSQGITFTYDEENDKYICSEGKELRLKSRNKKSKNSRVNVYVGISCQSCPKKRQCTTSKDGRHISRYWNQDYRDKHRRKMQTQAAKQMSILRKSSIEHVFGTLKVWFGKIPLLTRGLANVKTEIKLFSISYNIKRLMSLLSIEEIIGMISVYLGLNCQRTLKNSIYICFNKKLSPEAAVTFIEFKFLIFQKNRFYAFFIA